MKKFYCALSLVACFSFYTASQAMEKEDAIGMADGLQLTLVEQGEFSASLINKCWKLEPQVGPGFPYKNIENFENTKDMLEILGQDAFVNRIKESPKANLKRKREEAADRRRNVAARLMYNGTAKRQIDFNE